MHLRDVHDEDRLFLFSQRITITRYGSSEIQKLAGPGSEWRTMDVQYMRSKRSSTSIPETASSMVADKSEDGTSSGTEYGADEEAVRK